MESRAKRELAAPMLQEEDSGTVNMISNDQNADNYDWNSLGARARGRRLLQDLLSLREDNNRLSDRSNVPVPFPRIGKRSDEITPAYDDFYYFYDQEDDQENSGGVRVTRNAGVIPMARLGRSSSGVIPMARLGRGSAGVIPMARLGRSNGIIPMARLGRSNKGIIPMARLGRSFIKALREEVKRHQQGQQQQQQQPVEFEHIPRARVG